MKVTLSKDGKLRFTVRVAFRLGRMDLVDLVADELGRHHEDTSSDWSDDDADAPGSTVQAAVAEFPPRGDSA
jgi:hypothetical protein